MNDKINLPALVQLLALRSGDTKKQAEDFIKALFKEIADALAAEDSVKLKGIGVFKVIEVEARKSVNVSTGEDHEIPAHRKVVFIPDKDLAAAVNEPFNMFETVEIADEIPNMTQPEVQPEVQPEEPIEEPEEPTEELEEPEEQLVGIYELAEPDGPDTSEMSERIDRSDKSDTSGSSDTSDNIDKSEAPEVIPQAKEHYETPHHPKSRFGIGFLCGVLVALLCIALGFCAAYYVMPRILNQRFGTQSSTRQLAEAADVQSQNGVSAAEATAEEIDTIVPGSVQYTAAVGEEAPTRPSDERAIQESRQSSAAVPSQAGSKKVYDTITKTRYLTTMAKDHYGNFNLWPYIYEENKAILGHPDRIKPGTQVVVPDLKKYGVDPKNPQDIAKAKRKGVEIYSRFK